MPAKTKTCRACASVIPYKAKLCAECGSYNKPKSAPVLPLFVLLAAIAAGGFHLLNSQAFPLAASEPAARFAVGIGEPVRVGDLQMTVLDFYQRRRIGDSKPSRGKAFVVAEVSYRNMSPDAALRLPHLADLSTPVGRRLPADLRAAAALAAVERRSMRPQTLAPKSAIVSSIVFEADETLLAEHGWTLILKTEGRAEISVALDPGRNVAPGI